MIKYSGCFNYTHTTEDFTCEQSAYSIEDNASAKTKDIKIIHPNLKHEKPIGPQWDCVETSQNVVASGDKIEGRLTKINP